MIVVTKVAKYCLSLFELRVQSHLPFKVEQMFENMVEEDGDILYEYLYFVMSQ